MSAGSLFLVPLPSFISTGKFLRNTSEMSVLPPKISKVVIPWSQINKTKNSGRWISKLGDDMTDGAEVILTQLSKLDEKPDNNCVLFEVIIIMI